MLVDMTLSVISKVKEKEKMRVDVVHVITASLYGAATAAAGGVVAATSPMLSLALSGVSGACAILGALYFRSDHKKHSARLDLLITLLFTFSFGAAFGGYVGSVIFSLIPGGNNGYQTPIAEYVVGGLSIGFLLTPIANAIINRIAKDDWRK